MNLPHSLAPTCSLWPISSTHTMQGLTVSLFLLLLGIPPSLEARSLQSNHGLPTPRPHHSPVLRITRLVQRDPSASPGSSGIVANPTFPGAGSSFVKTPGSGSNGPAGTVLLSWPGIREKAGRVQYGGGDVMVAPITAHFVLYGGWNNTGLATRVLSAFVRSLSSPAADAQGATLHKWWSTATRYRNGEGQRVKGVTLGNIVLISKGYQTQLSDGSRGTENQVLSVLQDQIEKGVLPLDGNALYSVLTAADVAVGTTDQGFCGFPEGYCGWHTQTEYKGVTLRTLFVGDSSTQCNSGCGGNGGFSGTPNGHYSMDSLMAVLSHEMMETVTNPNTRTGYTATGEDGASEYEIADLCNGIFDDADNRIVLERKAGSKAPPGATAATDGTYMYNVAGLEGYKFLVQTVASLSSQTCRLQDPFFPKGVPDPVSGESTPPSTASPGAPSPPSVTPPKVRGGVSDPVCRAGNETPCVTCRGPDGCTCWSGICIPLCQYSAKTGVPAPCSSCGQDTCKCTHRGICETTAAP